MLTALRLSGSLQRAYGPPAAISAASARVSSPALAWTGVRRTFWGWSGDGKGDGGGKGDGKDKGAKKLEKEKKNDRKTA